MDGPATGSVALYWEIAPQITTRALRARRAERGVEDLAADVVEVDVDPLRAVLAQARGDVLRLVVDRRVEAELLDDVGALLGAARDPDGAAVLQLRELSDDPADRAGGAGDDDGLARDRFADVEQPEVGGHAGHAERAQIHGQRRQRRVDLLQRGGVRDRILLNAEQAGDEVAGGERGIVGGEHFACGERAHHLADADRRDVGAGVVHPAAHRGVERDQARLHERLARARLG